MHNLIKAAMLAGVVMLLALEQSATAATFTVTNTNDSGAGSLRQAIADTSANNQDDTILFDQILFGQPQTIVLTSGQLLVLADGAPSTPRSLTIVGPGPDLLTLSGNHQSRVLKLDYCSLVTLSGLTISQGNGTGGLEYEGNGGGLLVMGGCGFGAVRNFTLINAVVSSNQALAAGGLFTAGSTKILNSAIINNSVSNGGGGIVNYSSNIDIENSTVGNNTAARLGGGINFTTGSVTLINTTVAFNHSSLPPEGNGGGAGGIYNRAGLGNLHLRNSIIASNDCNACAQPNIDGGEYSDGNNIFGYIQGPVFGDTATDHLNSDPLLDPVLTTAHSKTPYFALLAGSAAVDGGSDCVLKTTADGGCLAAAITTDQTGLLRPQDGDGDSIFHVDIGSIEQPGGDPMIVPDVPDLLPASDSGASDTDNITNAAQLNFKVGGIIVGSTVEIYRGSTLLNSVPGSGTSIDFTDSDALLDGQYTYRVRQTIGATTSAFSGINVQVDRTGPGVSIVRAASQPDSTWTQPIVFTGTLSEAAVGLDESDFSLAGSTADLSNAVLTMTSTRPAFDLQVRNLSSSGTVVVNIPAGRFQDLAGNLNVVSSGSNSVIFHASGAIVSATRTDPFFLTGAGFDDDTLDIALQSDGKSVIVGKFKAQVGTPWNRVVRLNADGKLDQTFDTGTGANGDVNTVKIQSDGKVLIAGSFTSFNGVPAGGIARLLQNGSLDTSFKIGAGVANNIYSIVVLANGKILVGGTVFTFNGVGSNMVARLETDGTIDQTFRVPSDLSGTVYCMDVQSNDQILIGGSFVNTTTGTKGMARLNSNGSLDGSFVVNLTLPTVRSIIQSGSTIMIGGIFQSTYSSNLARLFSSGAADPSFVASGISNVTKLALQDDGKLLFSGSYQLSDGSVGTLNRLNGDGSADTSFLNAENERVNSLVLTSDRKIIVAGNFPPSSPGGANRSAVRRFNMDGSRDDAFLTWSGAPNDVVTKIKLQPDGKILILGGFTSVAGTSRSRFARLNADGSIDGSFAPAVSGPSAFAIQPDGKIIAGGSQFTWNSTIPIYRLNSNGTLDPTFSATSNGSDSWQANVNDIAVQADGKILVAGAFDKVNNTTVKTLVRLNPDGTVDPSFNSYQAFNTGNVRKIALQPDGKILTAGSFTSVGGTSHSVSRLNVDGSFDPTFGGTQLSNYANDLEIQGDGKVLVGGAFLSMNGVPSQHVGRLLAKGGPDLTFTSPTLYSQFGVLINAVVQERNGDVIIGGDFSKVGDTTITGGLARLHSDGSYDPSFAVTLGGAGTVNAIAEQVDGKIVFGGYFSTVDGILRNDISRLRQANARAFSDFDGDGRSDECVFRPSNGTWYLNRSQAGFTGYQFGTNGDLVTPADFTGDGKTDVAVFRPSTGTWFIMRSEDNTFYGANFGVGGDIPAPGDYDGDGKADTAVFRPSSGTWFIQQSTAGFTATGFGTNVDVPTVGDFDGDGKSDVAVFRPSSGTWFRLNSSNGGFVGVQFGQNGDKVTAADYTGDGKTDIAIWRPANGTWYIMRSEDGTFYGAQFGVNGDLPTPGDYDGDGKADVAVFRPSTGTWFEQLSTSGFAAVAFGTSGDKPAPNAFVY